MSVKTCAILAALLLPAGLFAQDYLFVSSEPMGAAVYLDGVKVAKATPLLLRDQAPGKHRLRLEKPSWIAKDLEVDLPATTAVEVALSPVDPLVHFEGESALRVAGRQVAPDGVFGIKAGGFAVKSGPDGLDVTPIFGRQRLLDGIRFALPLFVGLTGILTAREIFSPRDGSFIVSPELAASALIGVGLLGWDIALEAKGRTFIERYEAASKGGPESLAIAAKLRFEAAGQAMIRESFDSALPQFEAIARDYPDSEIAPRALFECARLKYNAGDRKGAAEDFASIVRDYPLVDLYDRSLKGLADCLLAAGNTEGALAELDLLTYLGPGLTREEIELYRQSIPSPVSSAPRVLPGSAPGEPGTSP